MRPVDFLVAPEGRCRLPSRMKRILSLAVVLCCISLVAACAKKPQSTPPPNSGATTGSGEVFDSLETVQAKADTGDINAQF